MINAVYFRSVRGQLVLLAGAFVGAMGLAVVSVCLRAVVFERFVRDRHPEPSAELQRVIDDLHGAGADARVLSRLARQAAEVLADREARKRPPADEAGRKRLVEECYPRGIAEVLDPCYGWWLRTDVEGADAVLASLLSSFPQDTAQRLRRTLVVGDPGQRQRALAGVVVLAGVDAGAALELAGYAEERARRRGESELAVQAAATRGEIEKRAKFLK